MTNRKTAYTKSSHTDQSASWANYSRTTGRKIYSPCEGSRSSQSCSQ